MIREQNGERWIEEIQDDAYGMKWKLKSELFSGRSEFQKVDVVETISHGRMLLNDDLVMVTERDEHVYHEMIAHVPMFTHPHPKRVLVIGGGDGGTVREVLRHPSVETCVLVEIDGMVIDACKKFIPQTAAALSDTRAEVRVEDGVTFLSQTRETFDLILVDSTDPIGPAAPLFGREFYAHVNRCLTENGIVVSQGECAFYHIETQRLLLDVFRATFPKVYVYNYHNLTYPGGMWSFAMGSKNLCPWNDFRSERVVQSGLEFRYYCPEIHKGSFLLPAFMLKSLGPIGNRELTV